MGGAAATIGGALLGLGVSALMSKKQKTPDVSALNANFAQSVAAIPQAPQAPVVPDGDGTKKSDDMLAAEEEERKRRLAEAEANKTNHTSGLGVTGDAAIGRKTLLG